MREIDLIPSSYRRQRARVLLLKVLIGVGAVMIVGTALARMWLDITIRDVQARIASLQQQQTISSQEREGLAALTAERDNFLQQLYVLKGLRSGTAAANLFRVVDESLVGEELWFRNWQFRRAGVTNDEGRSIETGYFVVVADDAKQAQPWQVETHMTISGQALDHEALSKFATRLLGRPEIESVRIRRTEVQRYAARNIVDFDLAVVINRRVLD